MYLLRQKLTPCSDGTLTDFDVAQVQFVMLPCSEAEGASRIDLPGRDASCSSGPLGSRLNTMDTYRSQFASSAIQMDFVLAQHDIVPPQQSSAFMLIWQSPSESHVIRDVLMLPTFL